MATYTVESTLPPFIEDLVVAHDPQDPDYSVQVLAASLAATATAITLYGDESATRTELARLLTGADSTAKTLAPAIERWRKALQATLEPDDIVICNGATIKRMKDGKKVEWNPGLLLGHANSTNKLLASVVQQSIELVPVVKNAQALQDMLDIITQNPALDPEGTIRATLEAARTETPDKGGLRITRK